MDEPATKFTHAFFQTGKAVAAICHGPWVLVEGRMPDDLDAFCHKMIEETREGPHQKR